MFRPKEMELTPQALLDCVREHQGDLPRLDRLYRYFKGEHAVLGRRAKTPASPNNRIVAPNAYYITMVANGFTFANPLSYKGEGIENLIEENKLCRTAAHDAEVGENLSIYGRAYELVYMAELPWQHVKLSNLTPENCFVVYSDEIDPEPLFGVYYCPKVLPSGKAAGYRFTVYDRQEQTLWEGKDLASLPWEVERRPHYAGQVPILEYKNNDEGLGDYERVISLIDAYDRLASDRMDDKDQFVESILAIYGARLIDSPEEAPEVAALLREYGIVDNLPVEARMEYLKKALDEAGVEVLRQALKADISKFSLVPELTDENFAGNASGVAMEYKTLGLRWLANTKRRMFQKTLSRRLQIMNSYMERLGRGFDWTKVEVVFSDSLPVDVGSFLPYGAQALSRRTMVAYLADKFGVSDVGEELLQVEKEQEADAARESRALNGTFGMAADEE